MSENDSPVQEQQEVLDSTSNNDVLDSISSNNEDIDNIKPIELTDEEKRELLIKQIKESKFRFKPIKQVGNITINKFGTKFKKERKRKNKQAKKSRSANRK